MPTPRKTPKPPAAGGKALKRAIHVARARAGLTSDVQLSVQAGVHYDTLMNWYGDRTVPRPAEVKKVATVLGVPYGDLMAAYDGTDPEPKPVQDALVDLANVLRESIEEDRATRATIERVANDMADVLATIAAALAERGPTTIRTGPAHPPPATLPAHAARR